MYELMWVFCEWANKIKAQKFVPQHLSHLKKMVKGIYLVVVYTIQVTSSSMRLIKLLSTI